MKKLTVISLIILIALGTMSCASWTNKEKGVVIVIEKIKKKYGDIGSGYPADPVTKAFLQDNWNKHPEIFRKTWASYKKVVKAQSQKGLGDF